MPVRRIASRIRNSGACLPASTGARCIKEVVAWPRFFGDHYRYQRYSNVGTIERSVRQQVAPIAAALVASPALARRHTNPAACSPNHLENDLYLLARARFTNAAVGVTTLVVQQIPFWAMAAGENSRAPNRADHAQTTNLREYGN